MLAYSRIGLRTFWIFSSVPAARCSEAECCVIHQSLAISCLPSAKPIEASGDIKTRGGDLAIAGS